VRLHLRAYEGGLAPTLRMKPGETLKIRLINDLPPNRDIPPGNPSHPHQFNNTNLHFHGAHGSPSGIADNVMRLMAPGKSYDIEIALPADHTRGTYWYHPHHHGSADVQVASGMVGAIIVEGDFADVPEIARARERVMLLSQVVFDAFYMIEDFGTLFPETATRFLAINGQRLPMIDMRPGEVQRWRVRRADYRAGAGAAPTGASYLQGSSVALADMAELRCELSIHRDRLDQSPLPHAFCDRGDPASAVVQFRASVFHFPASALYGVDGGEQIGAATGRVLCGGFLPGECDLRMFDLGTHSRSRGFTGRAQHHALSIGHHLMPFWNCRHRSAEISTGWTRYLHLLPDRLSETDPPGLAK
jgi:hypothetical protein